MAPVLGYWNIRGLGEPIRCLLHYLEVEFEDKRYEFGPEPNYFDSEWSRNDKKNLGLELANIPYYIDGDVKITQSTVIMRYLARKHGLYFPADGNTTEALRFETMEGQARDFSMGLGFAAYNPNFEQWREKFASNYVEKIQLTADFLGDKPWLFGDKISHIDFLLFEALDCLKLCYPTCCDGFPNLVEYLKRFESLPGVEKYRKTSMKWPIFSPFATWGGKGEAPN